MGLEKNIISRSFDHIFGSDFMFLQKEVFYKQSYYSTLNGNYNPKLTFNALMTVHLNPSPYTVLSIITPGNFVEIISLLGGFVTMTAKLIGWMLRSYQGFQFRKSSIKKLYYYSRTKKKGTPSKKYTEDDLKKSHATMVFTEGSDFHDRMIRSHSNFEKKEDESIASKEMIKNLHDIVYSKCVLSFGYTSFVNYYYKLTCLNLVSCCGRLGACLPRVTKSSMTARKYKRAKNAHKKITEEMDLLQIIKTLRKARFLIESQMTTQQQQLIDYFKEYSLETNTI